MCDTPEAERGLGKLGEDKDVGGMVNRGENEAVEVTRPECFRQIIVRQLTPL